jgi:hypothetical protein
MLSSVLHSERAAQVNVEIMRTFVRLREVLSSHADLARKMAALERKCDAQFKAVFDAIRALMAAPATAKRKIAACGRGERHTGYDGLEHTSIPLASCYIRSEPNLAILDWTYGATIHNVLAEP